ncbi:MAG: hypothetical protein AAFV53_00995 [Myxococcota bacterium]
MRLHRVVLIGGVCGGLAGCDLVDSILETVEEAQNATEVCGSEAWRGDIYRVGVLENTYETNGFFEDLVFDTSSQTFEMEVQFNQFGVDSADNISTDCAYQGMAYGAVSDVNQDGFVYTGLAVVQSLHPERDGCLAEPQEVEVVVEMPISCEDLSGEWIHDAEDSYGTGEGTFRATESYPLTEVTEGDFPDDFDDLGEDEDEDADEDEPDADADEPAFGPEGCPIGEDILFSGPLDAKNGCVATLNTWNVIDAEGHLTGEMWLTDYSGNCQLIEGVLDAWVVDGQVTGTVEGAGVVADGYVEIVDECTAMTNGRFDIPDWGDEEDISFELFRID